MTLVEAVVLANTRMCVAGMQGRCGLFVVHLFLNCACPDLVRKLA